MAATVRAGLSAIKAKSPSDVVLVSALRLPVARFKGSYKDTHAEELLAEVLKATREKLEKQGLDVAGGAVEDISVGTVLMELGGAKSGRLASLHAGFPIETCFRTVNRQCSSSLQSITDVAASIQTGAISIGIAAGAESMTRDYGTRAIPAGISPHIAKSPNQDARDCLLPMGFTSENVAAEYGIGRERQDAFAARSHQKAAAAQRDGLFDDETVPVTVRYQEKPAGGETEGKWTERTVRHDEGVRANATPESMGKLKPAFKEDGTSTAGNSSQISDGASAVTLARRDVAEKLGLKPIARFIGTSVVGVPPRIMGIGPSKAVPALLKRYGLATSDIGIWELNEAFASQALMCIDHLKLDEDKVNLRGGAIALGHPLGATGGRLATTLVSQMHQHDKELGVATLCCGTGFGLASLFARE